MSKSLGNVLLVHDLLQQAPGEAIRLALLSGHYRQPLDWSDRALQEAKAQLDRLYRALDSLKDAEAAGDTPPAAFLAALEDDLNTPKALAELHSIANTVNKAKEPAERARLKGELRAAGALLGLLQIEPDEWFGRTVSSAVPGVSATASVGRVTVNTLSISQIEKLIEARSMARAAKNWAESDRIRDLLAAQGILLEDKGGNTSWRRAS
jgi:cysteinyl-tRNA synthetase